MGDPQPMLETDAIAKGMLAKFKIPMPNQNASEKRSTSVWRTNDPSTRA
jgi:hypothetical protein